jgi:hypothetical protein
MIVNGIYSYFVSSEYSSYALLNIHEFKCIYECLLPGYQSI